MITIRAKSLFLFLCFLEALWLLTAQTIGSMWLLFPCLSCFLVLVVWSAVKKMAMPVMLFFLPFSPLLKLDPDGITFYTVALLLVYAMYMVTSSKNVRIIHLVPTLCLIAFLLVVKTAYGYAFSNSFIMFSATLVLIPFLGEELDGHYSFFWLTVFFAIGIVFSAITASFLTVFSTVARYINIDMFLGVTRRSGYYADPNFYSAHISAALGGILMVFLHNDKKRKLFVLVPLAVALLYCGLMAMSKTFFVVSVSMLLLWLMDLLFRKGKISVKVTLLLTFVVAFLFLLSSTVFVDMLNNVLSRFGNDGNLSNLTTGRTDLWVNHLKAIVEDPWLLLFGAGYTNIIIVGEFASHNTIIQTLTQFGLVGSALFLAWSVCFIRNLLGDAKIYWSNVSQIAILVLGVFGPWMALDYLFLDEVFLLPVYVTAAIRLLSDQNKAKSLLVNEKVWDE